MTPSLSGRIATTSPGVRPIKVCASSPTARIFRRQSSPNTHIWSNMHRTLQAHTARIMPILLCGCCRPTAVLKQELTNAIRNLWSPTSKSKPSPRWRQTINYTAKKGAHTGSFFICVNALNRILHTVIYKHHKRWKRSSFLMTAINYLQNFGLTPFHITISYD